MIKNVSDEYGNWTETVYYVNENFVRILNSSGTYDFTYVKHGGSKVAELKPDGSKIFIHGDHIGSTDVITDENGNVLENSSYTPYGKIISGGESRYDYEGMEYDDIIDQYDFNFRGYKAEWGIFTQPDSLLPNVHDPQQLNRYSFERSNPWKNTDPTGHCGPGGCIGEAGLLPVIGVIGLAIWAQETVTFIGKLGRGEATRRDKVYAGVNTALNLLTFGLSKGASSLATLMGAKEGLSDKLTDYIMKKLELKEEQEGIESLGELKLKDDEDELNQIIQPPPAPAYETLKVLSRKGLFCLAGICVDADKEDSLIDYLKYKQEQRNKESS